MTLSAAGGSLERGTIGVWGKSKGIERGLLEANACEQAVYGVAGRHLYVQYLRVYEQRLESSAV